ncbi:hypothetical protein [Pseudomonas sp. M2]|uniref:tail fiber domain-containing protein n=2 Tax=Pseudomonas sp. M2 TaxID=228756 RepID=UPI0018C95DC0|nr:hypothetical protein [Pseudomonas sp. M2]MBG6123264.1 hypothetical protein [Pseudomonas sp. M2]HDS1744194.1 hypothetical protein [Pseudomonas putida]
MAYNTGNPVGSTDPRDLYDNAPIFDKYVNGDDPFVTDRLGKQRLSISGQNEDFQNAQDGREAAFDEFLESSAFIWIGDYGPGLTFTSRSQYTVRDGYAYRLANTTTLPYTTTGNWSLEQSNFSLVNSDDILRQDLSNHTDPEKGAAEVGRATRQINSVAELRTVPGRYHLDQCQLVGYHAAFNGYGGGGVYWDAASTATDDGATTFAVAGQDTGRWIRINFEASDVYQWGAIRGQECSDAIQAAFDWVRARGPGTVDLGKSGFFLINKPLRGCQNLHLKGKAVLRAQAPFSTVVFDVDGGGTLEVAPMLYFVDTPGTTNALKVKSVSGSRRFSVVVEKSIELDCDEIAGFGVFLDNYIDCEINCRIRDATKWGVWLYFYCWGNQVHSYITGPGEGGIWLGSGCNGVDLTHAKVWGDNKTPTIAGLLIDGDINGLACSGTFIEKVAVGAIIRNTSGPVNLTGIDFEQITGNTIRCEGATTSGRQMGPIVIASCFLETSSLTAALVYSNNAVVICRGNRMRNAALAYEVVGNGYVCDENNTYTNVTQVGGNRVLRKGLVNRSLYDHNYSQAGSTLEAVREISNYSYQYTPSLVTSGLSFSHGISDTGTQRLIGSSTWFVCDMLGGAESNRMGVSLAYTGGGASKVFCPIDSNLTDLGGVTNLWKVVRAGTGTISTSDATHKTPVRGLTDEELRCGDELSRAIGAYKFLDAVEEKGAEARDHIGMTVQKAIEIMESHGLDPFSYGFICYDEWEEKVEVSPAVYAEVQDEQGNVIQGDLITPEIRRVVTPAGSLYSFRVDELKMFMMAGVVAAYDRRIRALEEAASTNQ